MNALIIMGSVCLLLSPVLAVIHSRCSSDNEDVLLGVTVSTAIIGLSLLVVGVIMQEENAITPLDVYRGRTELQIEETRRGETVIKRDSTGVWKHSLM